MPPVNVLHAIVSPDTTRLEQKLLPSLAAAPLVVLKCMGTMFREVHSDRTLKT